MKNLFSLSLRAILFLGLSCSAPSLLAGEHDHGVDADSSEYRSFGFDFTEGWFDRAEHRHVSALGTPMAHPFRLEPASIHSDVFVDYSFRKGAEGNEQEAEMEMEFALTRRIGLVVEVPYSYLNPKGGASVDGLGDLAIAPRFLLAEYERFSLAFNIEVELPTGDEARGLGGGEVAYAPSISTWHDLGNWWVLNTQTGLESSSSSNELFFLTSLIHTLGSKKRNLLDHEGHEHDDAHKHLPKGLLSLILELDTRVGLSGDAEKGSVAVEGILGAYYGVTEAFNLRLGYQFPVTNPREFDGGLIVGALWLF
ncbi:MAG: hypothetical protein L3J39_11645 [Verrucomicrobiales bacterium]|nr:hypothetical protein [Verrucomicrobiales bacterium]